MPDKDEKKKQAVENFSAASLGITMAVGVGFFTYIGYLIDQKTGGGQMWTLAGIFAGLLYCGYEVWKVIRKIPK